MLTTILCSVKRPVQAEREQGLSARDAILHACLLRFLSDDEIRQKLAERLYGAEVHWRVFAGRSP
jgi:hypothetical protein